MITPGKYTASVVSVSDWTSPEKGTPAYLATFKLEDGQTIQSKIWLTEGAEKSSAKSLDAMGFNGDLESMVGNTVSLVIEEREYIGSDGKTYKSADVKWINSLGGGQKSAPTSAAEAASRLQRMKAAVAALRGNGKSSPADDVKF